MYAAFEKYFLDVHEYYSQLNGKQKIALISVANFILDQKPVQTSVSGFVILNVVWKAINSLNKVIIASDPRLVDIKKKINESFRGVTPREVQVKILATSIKELQLVLDGALDATGLNQRSEPNQTPQSPQRREPGGAAPSV